MPCVIGYLRPDINSQNIPLQLDQLKAAGATKIYQEQSTGAKHDRPQLDKLMADVRRGDTVVVTSLDRIAHNTRHLLLVVESLDAAGVTFKVIDSDIDTSTSHGKVICSLLGAITDFERRMVRERQAQGIDIAKREGRYKGRKPTAMAKTAEVLGLNAQGLTRQKIADQSGIGVASVYRILRNHATSQKKPKKSPKKTVDKLKPVDSKPTHKPTPVESKPSHKPTRKPTGKPDIEQLSLFS